MSTIKSSDEHLTLNADGSSKDIKFQANGVEKASISSAGAFTSTTIDATALTGNLPAISGANLTGISSFDPDAAVVFNESGADVDFRVESDVDTHALFVNGADSGVVIKGQSSVRTSPAAGGGILRIDDNAGEGGAGAVGNHGGGVVFGCNDGSVDGYFAGIKGGLGDGGGNTVGHLKFYTRGATSDSNLTERLRIEYNGTIRAVAENFATGMSTSNYGWELIQNGSSPYIHHVTNGTSNTTLHVFINDNGTVGTIKTNGSATSFNTSSDYRLKENVDYTWDATTRLKQLKPARFNFIADGTNTLVDGFIAHEVSSVVPEAISGAKDAMTAEVLYVEGDDIPEGKNVGDVKTAAAIDPQGIDQSKLVPLLVKTIQELEARITALEA